MLTARARTPNAEAGSVKPNTAFASLRWLFGGFLAFALLRTLPFTERTAFEAVEETGEGNLTRQLLYLLFFAGIVLPAAHRRGRDLIDAVPVPFALFIGFCLISLLWSPVPGVAVRRTGLTLVIAACLLVSAQRLKPGELLSTIRTVCVSLSILSLVSGIVLPGAAYHLPGDPEPAVVGSLRGLFYHKNITGAVAAISIILCLDWAVRSRRYGIPLAAAALCVATLILTQSKTSVAFTVVAAATFYVARWHTRQRAKDPSLTALLLTSLAVFFGAVFLSAWSSEELWLYITDPEAFTGRGYVWKLVGELIAERPLFGHGYESVFQVGVNSPLLRVSTGVWISTIAHSHNGLLDLLVSVGVIGALLYFSSFLADPLRRLSSLPQPLKHSWLPIILAIIVFLLGHSLLEGRILSGESATFMFLTIVAGVAKRLSEAQYRGHRAPRRFRRLRQSAANGPRGSNVPVQEPLTQASRPDNGANPLS